MSNSPDTAEDTGDVPAQKVVDYLRRHPDFLERRKDVLDHLSVPRRGLGDNVQDLQACMIDRLRRENAALKTELEQLIRRMQMAASRDRQIQAAALALAGSRDLNQIVETATGELAWLLDVDTVALAVETECPPKRATVSGVHCLASGSVLRLLGEDRDVIARSPALATRELFGASSELIRSELLIRFGGSEGLPSGILALGSRKTDHFRSGEPSYPYRFLAGVLDQCLLRVLKLPT